MGSDSRFSIVPFHSIPDWFLGIVKQYTPESDGRMVSQLLWHRGIQDPGTLINFLDPNAYHPTSPFAFGQEMKWAIQRLSKALKTKERVTIWGDFDADGITATSVLWEGLGQFFPQHLQLNYYIPNRFTESHGLNCSGLEKLVVNGTKLIITCDTGSTNLAEIEYANQLGIDIIVTDHHTLPDDRPSVISIINPRYFADNHPLFHLSGVAVAYKLVEALYQTFPDIPKQPLENLLDLVAIGLIADLVQLKGDCRYLAQKGIEQIQKTTHPGVTQLLKYSKKTGSRPTDISYGIGPRINAVSRIHGDGTFCVELLTSQDEKQCKKLAVDAELANTRRKSLQNDLILNVKKKLARMDLSTTGVIVLEDPQWPSGILGLVAGQIAAEYGKPTILLSTTEEDGNSPHLARGSARSVQNIDLYELVNSQSHLLHRFGGHPFAAGLSMLVENIPLFREGINQKLRQKGYESLSLCPSLEADLIVTVADLGLSLFRELKLLEPCGMGNNVPKLMIKNCYFKNITWRNIEDLKGNKIKYQRVGFQLFDDTIKEGFPGVWWGQTSEEIPQNICCDVIVELDLNTNTKSSQKCELRLIAIQTKTSEINWFEPFSVEQYLIDWRNKKDETISLEQLQLLEKCPTYWQEIQKAYRQALAQQNKLALAYSSPLDSSAEDVLQQLIGIGKYLSRTNQMITKQQLKEKLNLSDRTLELGLKTLINYGISYQINNEQIQFILTKPLEPNNYLDFIKAFQEEQFQKQYFSQVPFDILQKILEQNRLNFSSTVSTSFDFPGTFSTPE
ncbi:single-stranded-DNA-specific exonuclease RecJ [Aphanothece hegewaldii CCALA 016]|uniref:Single-stranded-DNA-specific exonuclease RecJ n=1 Tax=Aphanothece hegewaldii CCALA 016 TaxID=2107694 RepID=A0A2T1LW66_9CHRO|nr:single-stranded-DNA-specific exonuclease RecJ [Aphanothece hegewaldii]PSF36020.1 single-stranded-DNA-specific exonuclease RecJ [Aphanothece hegewaldii CCALA 016]